MDPPNPPNEDDDVFSDGLDEWPFYDFTDNDPSEPSGSGSTICYPAPITHESPNSQPHPSRETPSPATTMRCRSTRSGSSSEEAKDSSIDFNIGSESDLFDDANAIFRHRYDRIHRNLKENEKVSGDLDSNQVQNSNFIAPTGASEENNEESTITTSGNDDAVGDSADSAEQPSDLSSNLLESIVGLLIKAIGFQINLFIMFLTFPISFMYNCCMLFIDPFGTMRRGTNYTIGKFSQGCDVFCGFMSPSLRRWFKEHKSIWKVALHCGWGLLWSIYVCFILFGLLFSSLLISGFMMKNLVEKPIQKKEVLNFDFTKQSPVAYVPIISCASVVDGEHCENDNGISKKLVAQVIPPGQKVRVTVSLLVPESEYNRNLGIFQIRVDFLSSNGKIISSSSQPCMLRFRSEPIRLLTTFLKIAPLITGYVSETQTLTVKMRGFIEGDVSTSCLKVTLLQRAEYRAGAGIPEIYDASLYLESELSFFKSILWHWKATLFVWITMMAFMMELLFVLACCRPIIIPRTRQRDGSVQSTANENNPPVQS